MPTDTATPSCIYCGGPGPFTDEHVVPASIGADDRNWLLKGCVCTICNTDIFSPLETKFARSSPFYLSRLALQPRARNRGARTEPPKAQLRESLYFEPEVNAIMEAVIRGGDDGLAPYMLPQIHLVPGQGGKADFQVTGPDAATVRLFFTDLQSALEQEVTLIEKTDTAGSVRYTLHTLKRDGSRYRIESSTEAERPPKGGVWFASLAPVPTYAANTGATVTSRVFRRESGSLTCRCDDIEKAAIILGVLAEELPAWTVPSGTPVSSTPTPAYRQTLAYDHDAYCRVLAKIGLNIVAFTSGLAVMRQRDFDRARHYVLHGKPRLPMRPGRDDQIPAALDALAPDRHLIGIEVERRAGMEAVRAVFRFYGGPVQQIRLAAACARGIGVTPVWLSVDYVNHRVERNEK